MFLKKLNLLNFRNYSNLSLEFDLRPTILLGNNAVGKSNLLEAIYFLSTTKSARVDNEMELIKEEVDFCRVEGKISEHPGSANISDTPGVSTFHLGGGVEDPSRSHLPGEHTGSERKFEGEILEITLQNSNGQFSKRVKVNGVPRRVVDFVGNLPAVIFYPSDINMVTGSPALRRWHLDLALAQVDPEYKRSLTLYEQILTARNRVLKRIKMGEGGLDELTYWTDELLKDGQVVAEKRKAFFEFIFTLEKPLGNFEFKYAESVLTPERLDQYSSREIAAAATLIGPHRDDFDIVILSETKDLSRMRDSSETSGIRSTSWTEIPRSARNDRGRNLRHFGSRGEQRTATLAFKLAQLEYMAKVLGKRPILLLDDIFSELDLMHRAHVVEVVGKQQTIIATVELENIPKKFLDEARILKVEDGKIIE